MPTIPHVGGQDLVNQTCQSALLLFQRLPRFFFEERFSPLCWPEPTALSFPVLLLSFPFLWNFATALQSVFCPVLYSEMQGLDQCLLRALTGSMLTYCFIPTHCHLIVFRTLVQFPLPVLSCAGPLLTQTKTGPHEDSKKEVPHLWDGPKAVTSKKSWMILLLVKTCPFTAPPPKRWKAYLLWGLFQAVSPYSLVNEVTSLQ
jgi:hypothetical protein